MTQDIEAMPVTLVGGIWGSLAVELFANPNNLVQRRTEDAIAGLFYGGNVEQLNTDTDRSSSPLTKKTLGVFFCSPRSRTVK
jgi:ammonia channel protein AmtB